MKKEKKSNSRTKWISKHHLYPEASNFHNKIRTILLNGSFKNILAYQEVPLKDLVDDNNSMRIDWYIESFNICIELQGKQHYIRTNFGNKSMIESSIDFTAIQNRDSHKKALLKEAGYLYIAISYKEERLLSEQFLIDKIKEALK